MTSFLTRLLAVSVFIAFAPANPVLAATETVLHDFMGRDGGGYPWGGLVQDDQGNFYGTTAGDSSNSKRFGAVYKLAPDGTLTVLHRFKSGTDGATPLAGLIQDKAGNLYGTTNAGGLPCGGTGCGTVFKLAPDGTETVLYSFGYFDGAYPAAALIQDNTGNLYGTTTSGGATGLGTVFKLQPNGSLTVLHSFTGGSDGENPSANLIQDAAGNLYGTTTYGGTGCGGIGCGAVIKITPDGTESVLYSFSGGTDGAYPSAGLILDATGNLYGTTEYGGGEGGAACQNLGCGTIFKLAPDGTETVLYRFTNGADGGRPQGNMTQDSQANFYGVTALGGTAGSVFKLATDGALTVLYRFNKPPRLGRSPTGYLLLDSQGNLYGTTNIGGPVNRGVAFKIAP